MSQQTNISKISQQTQQVFDDLTQLKHSQHSILSKIIDNDALNQIWVGFGIYLAKQIRSGRAVQIPKFGVFTFSAPTFNMNGTTNQQQRETDEREPLFIISKEFSKGIELVPSTFKETGLTPIVVSSTAGKIQQQLVNYAEIGKICQCDSDSVKLGLQRIIRKLDEYCRQKKQNVTMEIPAVGTFYIRKKYAAIYFNQFIKNDCLGLFKIPVNERKQNINQSQLTKADINKIRNKSSHHSHSASANIDQEAQDWLNSHLSINLNKNRILSPLHSPGSMLHRNYSHSALSSQNQQSQLKDMPLNEDLVLDNTLAKKNNKDDNMSTISDISSNLLFESVSQRGKRMHNKKSVAQNLQIKQNPESFTDESLVIKKFLYTLRQNHVKPADVYSQLITLIYGIKATKLSKLSLEQFKKGIKTLNLDLYDNEIDLLFKTLDQQKNNYLNFQTFVDGLFVDRSPDKFIQDIMNKNKLTVEDMLRTLKITQKDPPLIKEKLVQAFKKLPYVFQRDAEKIAEHILKDKISITVHDLMNYIGNNTWNIKNKVVKPDNTEIFQDNLTMLDTNWLASTLQNIKNVCDQHANSKYLEQQFSYFDNKESGILDLGNFKTVFLKNKEFGLSLEDLNRLVRYLQKDENGNIDYYKFIRQVERSYSKSDDQGIDFVAKYLNKFMDENQLQPLQFIHFIIQNKEDRKTYNIQNPSSLKNYVFAKLTAKKIFPKKNQIEVLNTVPYIDVNKDGHIDKYDLDTFLNRYQYIDDKEKDQINSLNNSQILSDEIKQDHYNLSNNNPLQNSNGNSNTLNSTTNNQNNQNKGLFPNTKLDDKKLAKIIKEVQNALFFQNISLIQAFRQFDLDGDGFVSVSEWNEVLDKWIKLSKPAKEGLFAYIDNLKIGMFDFNRWCNVMKRYVMETNKFSNDSFLWQEQILQSIKQWFQENNLTPEEAFRIMDCDFDGFVSKDDLKVFLNKIILIPQEDILPQKIDRLFKLMDTFKRGYIQKPDINKILQNPYQFLFQQQQDKSQTNNNTNSNQNSNNSTLRLKQLSMIKSDSISEQEDQQNLKNIMQDSQQSQQQHLNWLENACQQLTLKLTEKYKTLEDSFNEISKFGEKVKYRNFKEFIETQNVLDGFNLTSNLFQKLFAFIDPHKKGYLTECDWLQAFSKYSKNEEIPLQDLKDNIQFNFKSNIQAYQFFCKQKTQPIQSFLNGLLPQQQQENTTTSTNSQQKQITFESFNNAIQSLFQSVYTKAKTFQIYSQILKKSGYTGNNFLNQTLSYQNFESILGTIRKNDLKPLLQENKSFTNLTNNSNGNSNNQSENNRYSSSTRSINKSLQNKSHSSSKIKLQNISSQFPSTPQNLISGKFIIEKFKHLALASGKNLQQVFQQIDKTNSGQMTNIEFRNALWKLNLGLTSQDVQLIIKYANLNNPNPIFINWKDFLNKLKYSPNEIQILNRSKERLLNLKKNLYHYMISPKDAFRQFDKKKTGLLAFTDFQSFMENIHQQCEQELPSFTVLKDIFDFIDIKKDGYLDIEEWLQAFTYYEDKKPIGDQIRNLSYDRNNLIKTMSQFHQPSNIRRISTAAKFQNSLRSNSISDNFTPKTQKPNKLKYLLTPSASTHNSNNSNNGKNKVPQIMNHSHMLDGQTNIIWERSREYDAVINMIAKNRLYLQEQFKICVSQSFGFRQTDNNFTSQCEINTVKAKEILQKLFRKHQIEIGENNWKTILGFAEKKGKIDYKLFLEVYKQRLEQIEKPNIIPA